MLATIVLEVQPRRINLNSTVELFKLTSGDYVSLGRLPIYDASDYLDIDQQELIKLLQTDGTCSITNKSGTYRVNLISI